MSMIYKNTWGSAGSGVDQQRNDLFRFSVNLPLQLDPDSSVNSWDKEIVWAVEKFPFPARAREAVPIKYLNQTNFQPGPETQSEAVDVTVRYAFARRTAEILERWWFLTSNPKTGGSSLGSAIKTTGFFYWLVPNNVAPEQQTEQTAYVPLRAYFLDGVWVKDLSPSEGADMTSTNGLVTLKLSLQIDRYYPVDPTDLTLPYSAVAPGTAGASLFP